MWEWGGGGVGREGGDVLEVSTITNKGAQKHEDTLKKKMKCDIINGETRYEKVNGQYP